MPRNSHSQKSQPTNGSRGRAANDDEELNLGTNKLQKDQQPALSSPKEVITKQSEQIKNHHTLTNGSNMKSPLQSATRLHYK